MVDYRDEYEMKKPGSRYGGQETKASPIGLIVLAVFVGLVVVFWFASDPAPVNGTAAPDLVPETSEQAPAVPQPAPLDATPIQ